VRAAAIFVLMTLSAQGIMDMSSRLLKSRRLSLCIAGAYSPTAGRTGFQCAKGFSLKGATTLTASSRACCWHPTNAARSIWSIRIILLIATGIRESELLSLL